MSSNSPQDSSIPSPRKPNPLAIDAFCEYLRELEIDPDVDWAAHVAKHTSYATDLAGLLEEYERVSAILERLTPTASFSARLREHYGEGVDPEISLSGDRAPRPAGVGSSSKSKSKVHARLSALNPNTQRYLVRQEIARGGMGAIMEVWDHELRRTLAMKVVLGGKAAPGSSESSEDVAERRLSRFLEEAQITGQLDHPGIVPVHDIGIDSNARVYFTMQLVDGHDLRKVFEMARMEKGGWTQARVISVFVRVCEAMAYAHSKKVVHRDLKPANIMVGAFGEAYVMDWGLAKVLEKGEEEEPKSKQSRTSKKQGKILTDRSDGSSTGDAALVTLDGDIVGTPAYMAPEQARGELEDVGPLSDIYSMGAMLYHLFSGHAPYEPLGEKVPAITILKAVRKAPPWALQKIVPDVDGELAAICEKAMAREPGLRYESMMDLAADLRAWVEGRGVGAYTSGLLYEARKWMSRNRATTAAMVSIAVLMLTSFSLFIFLQQTHNATLQGKNSEVQATNQKLVQAEIDAEEKAAEAIASQKEMRSERDRAEREKDIAEEQKARADENSIQANLNQALADRRKQEAEQIAYSSSVAAAAFSLRLNEAEAVSNSLSGCPEPMRGWEWQHLNLAVDPSLGDLIVLGDSVTDLAVSPDGEVVMSYGLGLLPRLWDVDERRDMGAGFKFPGFVVLSSVSNKNKLRQLRCALSPDGFTAAVTSPTDASLRLMNTRTGEFMASFSEASTPILAVDFNADGGLAGVSCEDGHCWVFRVSGQRVVSKFEGHEGPTTGLVFSPDGKRVATCGADRTARIWDALTGDELVRLKGHHTDALSSLAWSPDSSRIVTASYDGSLAVWDTQSGVMISLMNGHLGGVFDVVFSSDNKFVFSGGEDRTVRMWSAATGRQERVFNGHESEVRSVVRLGDEGGIASVDLAGAVRCWDQRWDPSITNLAATDGKSFVKVLFGLSDRVVFAASSLDSLEAFDSNRGTEMDTELGELPKDSSDKGYYRNFAMAQGSGRIVLATSDRRVIVHENRESGPSKVFDGFESISRIAISDDGGAFVVGGKLRNVVVVDVETGVRISIALKHLLASLAISPDGKWVITAESDETLGVWDAQTGKRKASFPNVHSNRISSLCLSADGSLLVSASNDGTARIYTMPDLELRGSEFDHDQVSVSAIALSPVDDRLASGTADGRIRIWSLNTGKMLYSFMGLDGAILSLDFSSDGKRLLGLGRGTGAKIWETANGDERFQARYGSESGANGR